ncbi:MAG: hypothetical protein JWO48_2510, partial [Bryobacterales bacterium]|nr:hypothetical protein [Bryobacterales bacterium]
LTISTQVPNTESCWVAARVVARKETGEPDIQAHTNPKYLLRDGKPAIVRGARETLAARWEGEIAWYKSAPLIFGSDEQRRAFFQKAELALEKLRRGAGQ